MPSRFRTEEFVDAAVRLIAEGGPGAAKASAVARVTGAPSGSVYHRFPSSGDLLAAAWLWPLRRFQDEFLGVLAGGRDPVAAGVAAARQVVRWSADHPDDAALLARYGRSDFIRADSSVSVLAEADALDDRLNRALADYLAGFPAADRDRVLLAVVDGPLALVRRGLRTGGLDAATVDLAAEAARRLLAPR